MGGTTAKASLIEDGRVSRSREYEVGASLSAGSRLLRGSGELIRIPTIDIAEVGAGGGSIAWLDAGGALHVGPRSAGADPGRPATAAAAPSRPSPTRTSCSATSRPAGSRAATSTVDAELARARARRRSADALGLTRDRGRPRHPRPRERDDDARAARRSRPRRAATRATSRSSPTAAPARSTPPAWPPSSACARWSCRRSPGLFSAAGPAVRAHRVPRRPLLPASTPSDPDLDAAAALEAEMRDGAARPAIGAGEGASGCARPTSATPARAGTSRSTSPATRSTPTRSRRSSRASRPSTSACTASATRRARRSRSARSGSRVLGPARESTRAARRAPRPAERRRRGVADFGEAHGAVETPVVSRDEHRRASARAGPAADRRVRHDRRRPARLDACARDAGGRADAHGDRGRADARSTSTTPTRSCRRSSATRSPRSPTRWRRRSSAPRTRPSCAT